MPNLNKSLQEVRTFLPQFTTQLSLRSAVIFMFGLLHGLGVAGVLGKIGLQDNELVTALIAFNGGVGIRQLAVLALCAC